MPEYLGISLTLLMDHVILGILTRHYVDGISLTHGYPRNHIWTLISGYCPCSITYNIRYPSNFVGNNYYCEAADLFRGTLFTTDPLWDGKSCHSNEAPCCQRTLIPWFYRSLGYTTTNNVEMRICCDQETIDEDVTFAQYEIYVK